MSDTTISLIGQLSHGKVLLYGDYALDEFLHGSIDRISREAPVFIVSHERSEFRPGCAANAAANVAALGGTVYACGLVGDNNDGRQLIQTMYEYAVDISGLIEVAGMQTPLKTRVIAGGTHSVRQQIVRIDRHDKTRESSRHDQAVQDRLKQQLENVDAVLISDYGLGGVTMNVASWLMDQARARSLPVLVDSRYRLSEFAGATAMTPNQPEAEALSGESISTTEQLYSTGNSLRQKLSVETLVITRGSEGVSVFSEGAEVIDIPAYGSEEVVDVTGAGDTVIATFTLAQAAGADHVTAARLANVTGGLSVLKKGTSVVTQKEILEALSRIPMP